MCVPIDADRYMATEQEPNARMMKGQAIAKVEANVKRIDKFEYRVKSQSGNGDYQVIQSTEFGWYCSCPDARFRRGQKYKHVFAVELSLELRRRIENAKRIVPLDYQSCLACGSDKIVRHGILHNKSGDLQRYSCKTCGKRFTLNLGFEKMHATPKAITSAMQLYFTGESLRNVQKFLRLQGVKVSHVTVYKWIGKYVKLMDGYLQNFQPELSGTWRTDELYVKIKGNPKYMYALMDDETRFWIAQQVADTKYTKDIRPLLKEAKEIAGKKPDMLISDGAPNFHEAYKKEYWSRIAPRTSHIKHIHLAGDHNNNKMERLNGEVRDREKVMRGVKKMDSPIFKGTQLYHNYIREHEGLDRKTPAEVANIYIEGSNRWLTIIQNASHRHVQSLNSESHVQ